MDTTTINHKFQQIVSNIKTKLRRVRKNESQSKRKTFLKDSEKVGKKISKNRRMYFSKIEQWQRQSVMQGKRYSQHSLKGDNLSKTTSQIDNWLNDSFLDKQEKFNCSNFTLQNVFKRPSIVRNSVRNSKKFRRKSFLRNLIL